MTDDKMDNKYQLYKATVKVPDCLGLLSAEADPYNDEQTEAERQYEDYLLDKEREIRNHSTIYNTYLSSVIPSLLEGTDHKNQVFSPFSLYPVLVLLAALSEGETQAEITRLLDLDTIEEALKDVSDLMVCSSISGPGLTIAPVSSVWFASHALPDWGAISSMATILAEIYQGSMEDPEYTGLLRHWADQKTGGLLADSIHSFPVPITTAFILITAILLHTKWETPFYKEDTWKKTFHAPKSDITCPFMHLSERLDCWFGNGFTAVNLRFDGLGSMWFALPDEGKSPADIINDPAFINEVSSRKAEHELCDVDLSLPRFSMTCPRSIDECLQKLGIRRVYTDDAEMPFIKSENSPVKLDHIEHGACVKIDEEGVEASSYTMMSCIAGAALPGMLRQVKLVFDRPFVYWISIGHNMPLFIGICNNPAEE